MATNEINQSGQSSENRDESLSLLRNSVVRELDDLPGPVVGRSELLGYVVEYSNGVAAGGLDQGVAHAWDVLKDNDSWSQGFGDVDRRDDQAVARVKLRLEPFTNTVEQFAATVT